ncbi:MAG TPA: retropepsin-like aspartic protease [Candidatus Acidoferrum sp.]|nr:retropepsin-like aspartic protease [Candidatus Acidoferrum sp.]
MRRHLCAITTLAIALLKAQGATEVLAEIPFEFREGLLWVKVTVAESAQPLNFLLDTGAGASAINRRTADRLALPLGREVNVRGVETTLSGRWLKGIRATAGTVSLPGDYVAMDLTQLSHSCERPVDGLLGADFFRGRAVQIDFRAQTVRILKPDQPPLLAETLPLEMRPCGMRVPITVNDHKQQWVRLDTGCASPLQWVTSHVRSQECKPKVAIGLSELSIPQTETTVEIGFHKFDNVPTGLHKNPIFAGEAGLLGNGLLSRFSRVTVDAKARRLILEPQPVAP